MDTLQMDTLQKGCKTSRQMKKSEEFDIAVRMIPMRDGIRLHTRIYIPAGKGKQNVLLCRTPHELTDSMQFPNSRELDNGIISVIQTCRGMGLSEGDFYPWRSEREDTEDTIQWLRLQPWFGGKIVMDGISYSGLNALFASTCDIPELVGISPAFAAANLYHCFYENGAFQLYLAAHWAMTLRHNSIFGEDDVPDWDKMKIVERLPYKDIDLAAGLGEVDFWHDWVFHPKKDSYWQTTDISNDYDKVKAPALLIGGWFDHFRDGTLDQFSKLRQLAGSENARRYTRCIMGPWTHLGQGDQQRFGDSAMLSTFDELRNSFQTRLLSAPETDPLPNEPPLKYFMMGSNQWCSAETWPPKDIVHQAFYIHSKGCANSLRGNGTLDMNLKEEELPDTFIYDAMEPVPSNGGSCLKGQANGAVDQQTLEKRYDILVFTSEPLEEELKIAGSVKVVLWAASSAWDTDFTAKLVDVDPDGIAINLCDGIVRAAQRNQEKEPEFLVPESRIEYTISCGNTANCFKVGHRIRLEISSSNYPEYDVNSNTGGVSQEETERQIVRQLVFHEEDYPSRLVLPVLTAK